MSSNLYIREKAVRALKEIGGPGAIDHLTALLANANPKNLDLCVVVIEFLASNPSPSAKPVLLRSLAMEFVSIHKASVLALLVWYKSGAVTAQEFTQAYLDALHSNLLKIRLSSAQWLGILLTGHNAPENGRSQKGE